MTPTTFELSCIDIIRELNDGTYGSWFKPADVMSFIQIESAFKPEATRYEPTLGESSYGLMQLLESTARAIGFTGDVNLLFDAKTNITYGMKYLKQNWDWLAAHLGRDPTTAEWVASYNEGPGNVVKGRADANYTDAWDAARAEWSTIVAQHGSGPAAGGVAQPPPQTPPPVAQPVTQQPPQVVTAPHPNPPVAKPVAEPTDGSEEQAEDLNAQELNTLEGKT